MLNGDDVVSHGEGYFQELMNNKEFKKLYNEIKGTSKQLNTSVYRIIIRLLITFIPKNLKNL